MPDCKRGFAFGEGFEVPWCLLFSYVVSKYATI